jgi:acylphosphatase
VTSFGRQDDDAEGWRGAARRFRIAGRVQGVGFRAFAARAARALALRGGARNLDDGRVEVVAYGPDHALDRLEAALGEGTRLSRVSRVEIEILSESPSADELSAWDVEF